MKITCNREALLSSFQTAAMIAPSRSPKSILQNVKVLAEPDQTILMATDMEVGIRINVEQVQVENAGSAVLPVALFGSLLRENSDEQLLLEADDQGISVRGDRSKFRLPARTPDEFPNVELFDEDRHAEVSVTLVRELIRRTLFATDTESSRYALGGVLFEFDEDKITAVGTDGRRLAKMEGVVSWAGGYQPTDTMTIVPARSLQLIDRALAGDAPVQIAARPNDILLRSENAVIYSRLVDGRFPKWRDVIPQPRESISIDFTVGPLFSALRQASIMASDESRGIDFTFGDGSLVLQGQTADLGESRVELPIAYDGSEIKLKLDHRFVADFLKVMGADRTFRMDVLDAESAALCATDDGYSYVLMPLAKDRVVKTA